MGNWLQIPAQSSYVKREWDGGVETDQSTLPGRDAARSEWSAPPYQIRYTLESVWKAPKSEAHFCFSIPAFHFQNTLYQCIVYDNSNRHWMVTLMWINHMIVWYCIYMKCYRILKINPPTPMTQNVIPLPNYEVLPAVLL